jgi:hypothetical protein
MFRSALTGALLAVLLGNAAPAPGIVGSTCIGDCDADGRIDISDLIAAVKVVIGEATINECPSIACEADTAVACLVAAVEGALRGECRPGYVVCGNAVCDLGETCCDALFSVCTPPGDVCIQ